MNDPLNDIGFLTITCYYNSTNEYQGEVNYWYYNGNDWYIENNQTEWVDPPVCSFSVNATGGGEPLAVAFNDTSTNNPTHWFWNFGDGNTSTGQNPSHTYAFAGNFTASLTVSNNLGGSDSADAWINVSSVSEPPVADFTATPTSGNRPLTVQFTDNSTGSPTSWSWDFENDGTVDNTTQNPLHQYNSAGTFTVSLNVTNSGGCNVTVKEDYISVTSPTVNLYVFSDGIRYYHDYEGNEDLAGADTTAQYFYEHLTDGSRCHEYGGTNYCWNERSNPVNDDTGSLYWSQTESADSIGANSVEFAFHAGHGWEDGILFGTANNYHKVFRTNMSFSRAKWVALDSCHVLSAANETDWESVFHGLHILMGFDTEGLMNEDTGPQFVERMRGGNYAGNQYTVTKIRDAWKYTLQDTIHNSTLYGAYMWADPSGEDYLPGYGPFENPTETDGQYAINWTHFPCIIGG